MHSCIHAFMHSCIHAFMHSCIHAFMHSCIHAFMHSCIHSFTHSLIHYSIHYFIHYSIHFISCHVISFYFILHWLGVSPSCRLIGFHFTRIPENPVASQAEGPRSPGSAVGGGPLAPGDAHRSIWLVCRIFGGFEGKPKGSDSLRSPKIRHTHLGLFQSGPPNWAVFFLFPFYTTPKRVLTNKKTRPLTQAHTHERTESQLCLGAGDKQATEEMEGLGRNVLFCLFHAPQSERQLVR